LSPAKDVFANSDAALSPPEAFLNLSSIAKLIESVNPPPRILDCSIKELKISAFASFCVFRPLSLSAILSVIFSSMASLSFLVFAASFSASN
jgi:hypothetical protein